MSKMYKKNSILHHCEHLYVYSVAPSDELKALVKFWVGWEAPTATLTLEVIDCSLPKSSTCFETLHLPAQYKDYI